MKKVLIIQEIIPEYRIPIFNELASKVDLTILFSKGSVLNSFKFKTIFVPVKTFFSRFHLHTKNIRKICNQFDTVVAMFDLSFLNLRLLAYFPRKFKLIYWGIGVSASYNHRFDVDKRGDKKRIKYLNLSDACLFYSQYPVDKYIKLGLKAEKMFVANNTVQVLVDYSFHENVEVKKDKFLFIGSLYKQKRLDSLIEEYTKAYLVNNDIPALFIIGDGVQKAEIQELINKFNLSSKIHMVGAIYNQSDLVNYFLSSFLCFSPNQAGLSVLQSMGYGVPFVTTENAITGGEIFNINNGINGLLLKNVSEFKDIILDVKKNPLKYLKMGEQAKIYYFSHRTIKHMVDGFISAFDYVVKGESK